jgi:hypothetical protein
MVFAARLGERLGVSRSAGLADRTVALLDGLGLPTGGVALDPDAVWEVLARDKKAHHGVRFVLCTEPGGHAVVVDQPHRDLRHGGVAVQDGQLAPNDEPHLSNLAKESESGRYPGDEEQMVEVALEDQAPPRHPGDEHSARRASQEAEDATDDPAPASRRRRVRIARDTHEGDSSQQSDREAASYMTASGQPQAYICQP